MDRKTLALILTEVVLIVALVVVVAKDFNAKPQAEDVSATHLAKEATETVKEAAASVEEKAETVVEKAGEIAEETAETVVEKAEAVAEKVEHAAKGMMAKAGEVVKEVVEDDEKAEVKEEKKTAEKEEAAEPAEKAAASAGGAGVHDVIAMENAAYPKHTKGIVQFTHKKHYTEYKAACGDCHHDENAEPLKDLKEGDPVQGCIECHPKPGKAPSKKGQKLSDAEKMEYHTEALHANCIDCHKDYNKKNNTKAAPTSCGTCHPKDKK